MNQFRNIALGIIAAIGVFSTIIYMSCNKDKCGSTTCQNGGTCVGSTCSCPTGYSGSSCGTSWADGEIGTYDCSRSDCSPAVAGVNSWISAITRSSTDGGFTISISNFNNSNVAVTATVDSLNNVYITPASGTYGVSATGTYANDTLKLDFTTSAAGGVGGYRCRMTMGKKK